MTPRSYRHIAEQARLKRTMDQRMLELMTAQLTAMVANTGFRGWEEPRRVEEFFVSPELRPKPQRLTRKRRAAIATMMRDAARQAAGLPPDMRKFA